MAKQRVTPWTTAVALIQASQDADTAARYAADDGGGALQDRANHLTLGTSLAVAVRRLDQLRRQDRRADYGVVHQLLLEYLPLLVAGEDEIPAKQLAFVAGQLNALAQQVLALDGTVAPKPLDIAGAVAATDAELLREAAPDIVAALRADLAREFPIPAGGWSAQVGEMAKHPHLVRVAGSPLPPACPAGHQPRYLARKPKEISGDVLDCISCDACHLDYVLLPAGWFETPKVPA